MLQLPAHQMWFVRSLSISLAATNSVLPIFPSFSLLSSAILWPCLNGNQRAIVPKTFFLTCTFGIPGPNKSLGEGQSFKACFTANRCLVSVTGSVTGRRISGHYHEGAEWRQGAESIMLPTECRKPNTQRCLQSVKAPPENHIRATLECQEKEDRAHEI